MHFDSKFAEEFRLLFCTGKLAHRFKNENVKVTPSEQQPVSSWRFGLRGQVQRLWWERDQNPDLQQFWQKLSAKVWNKILT
jgi:hypothetical protein